MADQLDEGELLRALTHPLRRRILRTMKGKGPISPVELAKELKEPLSNTSYHVRVLSKGSAVKLVEAKPLGGTVKHYYQFAISDPLVLAFLELDEQGRADDLTD